nr:hypothetical protein BgiMline_031257 [Biomphalaria glabrata]
MKKTKQAAFLDKAHLWTVRTLMGITLAGSAVLAYQLYSYFSYIRPAKVEEIRKLKEVQIALEQQQKEDELMKRQKEAENFVKY